MAELRSSWRIPQAVDRHGPARLAWTWIVLPIFALMLAASASAGGPAHGEPPRGAPIQVPGDYSSIQEAIDSASDGQTIEVGPGIYDEALFIDKDLTLVAVAGPGLTLIDAAGAEIAVSIGTTEGEFDPGTGIYPNFVRFEGFHVIGWTERGIAQRLGAGTVEIIGNQVTATEGDTHSGISISGGQNSRVEDNVILGTSWSVDGQSSSGILAVGSVDAQVIGNQISGTDIGISLLAGFGSIDPSWAESTDVEVAQNDIQATDFGIAMLGPVIGATLSGNYLADVNGRAISIQDSDGSGLYAEDLTIIGNQAIDFGTRAYSSSDRPVTGLEIRNNLFVSTRSGSSGIQLGDGSSDVLLIENEVDVPDIALTLRSVNNVRIENNDLTGSLAGVSSLFAGHADNEIIENRILGGVVLNHDVNTDGYVLTDNSLLSGSNELGVLVAANANISSGPLAATCNWWDDPTGPGLEGTGQGSLVTEHVDFEPWNTSPEGPCDGETVVTDTLFHDRFEVQ